MKKLTIVKLGGSLITDKKTPLKAREREIDPNVYLEDSNELPFFKEVDDYIDTGPLASNVSDLILALKE